MKPSRVVQLIVGIGIFVNFNRTTASGEDKIKVAHWGHEKILIYAPLYVAMDGGYFAKEGLDVELVYSGNDDQVFATVISGAAQFGVGDPAFTAISREKGGEGKVIAALVGRVANWAVTKNPNIPPFTDPQKLDGMRITSFPSPSTTFTILSGLQKDLNLSKMEIKQLAFGTEQAALERNEADLAIMLEPNASVAESQGFRVVWSLAKYYGGFALTGVTATDSFIKKDPETVQRFVNGLQAALTFCATSPEAAAKSLEKNFPTLQPEIVRAAMKRMVDDETIPRSAVIDKEAWLKTLQLRNLVGDLKSIDIADACLDSTFAEAAKQGAGGLNRKNVIAPSTDNQSNGWTCFWTWFSRVADFVSLVSFAIIFKAASEIMRHRRVWKRLSEHDRKSGAVIANSFSNRHDVISEGRLVNELQSKRKAVAADSRKLLERFTQLKILSHADIDGEVAYTPKLSWLTNSAVLFDLWK